MDLLLITAWFLAALVVLFGVIANIYRLYIQGARLLTVLLKLILSVLMYGALSFIPLMLSGFVLNLGTHSLPRGSVLGFRHHLIGVTLIVTYLLIGWMIWSFVSGRWLIPTWFKRHCESGGDEID
jgi:hypothetical protein